MAGSPAWSRRSREWPMVRSRVVDFAPRDPADLVSERLASEVFATDGWAEVGYDQGRRIRLGTVESSLAVDGFRS